MIENRLDYFYRFVREERLFCAVLAHLLLQRGPNLSSFLQLVNAKSAAQDRIQAISTDEAQVYLEFSYLRDYWDSLETNDAKRHFIFTLIKRVPELASLSDSVFPDDVGRFNACFMYRADPRRIPRDDIVYPGQWGVAALKSLVFGDPGDRFAQLDSSQRKSCFQALCKFKWSFNIKPDMVILFPHAPAICVGAKLESPESRYPSDAGEQQIFDKVFEGRGQGRVGQLELQRFMFEYHLATRCRSVVIGRTPLRQNEETPPVFVTWGEVFGSMDMSSSLPHVERLLKENKHLYKA